MFFYNKFYILFSGCLMFLKWFWREKTNRKKRPDMKYETMNHKQGNPFFLSLSLSFPPFLIVHDIKFKLLKFFGCLIFVCIFLFQWTKLERKTLPTVTSFHLCGVFLNHYGWGCKALTRDKLSLHFLGVFTFLTCPYLFYLFLSLSLCFLSVFLQVLSFFNFHVLQKKVGTFWSGFPLRLPSPFKVSYKISSRNCWIILKPVIAYVFLFNFFSFIKV